MVPLTPRWLKVDVTDRTADVSGRSGCKQISTRAKGSNQVVCIAALYRRKLKIKYGVLLCNYLLAREIK